MTAAVAATAAMAAAAGGRSMACRWRRSARGCQGRWGRRGRRCCPGSCAHAPGHEGPEDSAGGAGLLRGQSALGMHARVKQGVEASHHAERDGAGKLVVVEISAAGERQANSVPEG